MNKTQKAVLERFAPVFAQKATREWSAADLILPVDLAGSLKEVRHNPKVLLKKTKPDGPAGPGGSWDGDVPRALVYGSVCETTTHFFLLYAVYHPMDWWKRLPPDNLYDLIREGPDEHIHDMEGVVMLVRKEPALTPDALVTVTHTDFYLYTQPLVPMTDTKTEPWQDDRGLRVVRFNETVDGKIWIDRRSDRPKLYIQSRGHGMYGTRKHWGGGEEVWYYYPARTKEPTPLAPQDTSCEFEYDLVEIFSDGGLWASRYDTDVFRQRDDGKYGIVGYDKVTKGKLVPSSANPPWSWNDKNDTSPIGEIATDPAQFFLRYCQGLGPVSTQYLSNQYLGIP